MERKAGVNMSDVKISNRALILNQLKKDRKSRKDIANKIQLTPASVTILVNELMQEGYIKESSHVDESRNVGRKKVFIELNKNFKYVLGVNIESDIVSIGIANLLSEILETKSFKINSEMPISNIITSIVETCMELVWNQNISKSDVLGVGVGIVGIVDSKNGISKHAYGLWKQEVDIRGLLEKELQLPVVVENNVRALATAEMELTEHSNIKNMVFIKYGPGVGSAIIINEEIYKGSYNNAGELGHIIIDTNGKECKCGQRGCLETVASIKALIADIKKDFSAESYPIINKLIDGNAELIDQATIIKAYELGEEQISNKMNTVWDNLAIGIVNIMRLYDPHKIIIHGELSSNAIFMQKLIEKVNDISDLNDSLNRIEKSILKQENCIGGIVLVTKELFFKTGGILHQ